MLTQNFPLLSLIIPITYAFAALLITFFTKTSRFWSLAKFAAQLSLGSQVIFMFLGLYLSRYDGLKNLDYLSCLVVLLVNFLAIAIIQYSETYLDAERGIKRYVFSILITIGSVNLILISHNLGVMAAAWTLTSLGLHQLLSFYPKRKLALIAAHKKFIAARISDACMLAALYLIFNETGSLELSRISEFSKSGQGSNSLFIGALLIAFAVITKSAMLPFHGWLMQVMEAPTPVSALLHAGVVNIGGFILIRSADLIDAFPLVQHVLVFFGCFTAIMAGLIMLVQTSFKLKLAWSTCSQMGFMILECGLGFYELALLHLVAHSLYKAYIFLSAGEAVSLSKNSAYVRYADLHKHKLLIITAVIAVPMAFTLALVVNSLLVNFIGIPSLPIFSCFIFAYGAAILLWQYPRNAALDFLGRFFLVIFLAAIFNFWHAIFGGFVFTHAQLELNGEQNLVILVFALSYVLHMLVKIYPNSALSRYLYPWFRSGLFLDGLFTRLSSKIWPQKKVANDQSGSEEVNYFAKILGEE